jgi:tight adherence protein B
MIGFSLPWFWLLQKRNGRLKAFAAQLPDALELVARALRAGHALGAGMHVVAEEMPDPIASEFGRVYEEQNLGIALEDAMRSMCERVPNMDLRFFVTAVAIQRQTGGDLAEILDKIGYVIRERYKILGQVKALTAEGRLSGVVLLILPFFLLVTMMHINYNYVKWLWEDPTLLKVSIGMFIWMVLGALVIRKIVDIKV